MACALCAGKLPSKDNIEFPWGKKWPFWWENVGNPMIQVFPPLMKVVFLLY